MTWESQPIAGGWSFTNTDHKAEIILDYLYAVGRGLESWVELKVDGVEVPVASGRRDLTTPDAAAPFLRAVPDSDIPWATGLREAFYFAVQADRDGAATIDLASIEPRDLLFLLNPIIESGGHTRLIAPGGSGKSVFALALALTVATNTAKFFGLGPQISGPVLYLDWETDQFTHARRMKALCDPLGVAVPDRNRILYRSERTPLSRSVQAVSRAVRASGAVMLIVDSAKMAAGPTGQSSGEESTLSMYTALRELSLPALIVDHKNKEDIGRGRRGGYGSIYMENLARMQWEFTRYTQVGSSKKFVLELTKENNVGQRPSLGFELVTKGDSSGITSARFTQISPDSVEAGTDERLTDRALGLFQISSEPMTVRRMAEMLEVSEASLRASLGRDPRFENVNEGRPGRPGMWRPTEEMLHGLLDDGIQDAFAEPPPVSDWRDGDDVY